MEQCEPNGKEVISYGVIIGGLVVKAKTGDLQDDSLKTRPLEEKDDEIRIMGLKMGENMLDLWPALRRATVICPHPHLMKIYGVFPTVVGRDYLVYYKYEVNAISLKDWMKNNSFSDLDISIKIELLYGLFSAVTHLHDHGIVHRDISIKNIWCVYDEWSGRMRFVLGDFENASRVDEEARLHGYGTEGYSPPEMYNGFGVNHLSDFRSDIYSLSATIIALLTRSSRVPLIEFTFGCREREIITEEYGIEVVNVLAKAADYYKTYRYESVQKFWEDLEEAMRDEVSPINYI